MTFKCMECGKKMTLRQAKLAQDNGCKGCGGADIDVAEYT